jgi:prepilin-type processing-associated H-X9-DG protein
LNRYIEKKPDMNAKTEVNSVTESHKTPFGKGKVGGNSSQQKGFTLLELVVVLGTLILSISLMVPALAKTKPATKTFQCLNNHRQLTRAWQMYAADNNDRVANNFGVSETIDAINSKKFDNWVNNVMTWGAGASLDDLSNTNVTWVTSGGLGKYADAAVSAYRCPADNYVSAVQVARGWNGRLRSVSMNSVFGRFSNGNDSTAQGLNWGLSQYGQYLKHTEVPKPFKTWLFLDEHPDSINEGYYLNNPTANSWQDIPASHHDGGCTFSFADGHAEVMKWGSATSRYPIKFIYPPTRVFDLLGRRDFAWYLERTGYIIRNTGAGQFGY